MKTCTVVLCAILALLGTSGHADAPNSLLYHLPANGDVVAFLLQSVDWYRHFYTEQNIATDPGDVLFIEDNRPIAAQIVRFSFDFAKADLALTNSSHSVLPATTQASSPSSDLARFLALKKQNDDALQKTNQDIATLKKRMTAEHGAERKKLEAALATAQSQLAVLQFGSTTLDDLVEFSRSTGTQQAQGDLASVIEDLAHTLPEINNPAPAQSKSPAQDAASRPAAQAHDSGVLGLVSQVEALSRKLRTIDDHARVTDNLASAAQHLRRPMEASISQIQADSLSALKSGDVALLQQHKSQLDALRVELQSVVPALVASDKQQALLAVYKVHLEAWRKTVVEQYTNAWKKLVLHVVILVFIVVLLVCISLAVRRVGERHVHDANRRRIIAIARHATLLFAIVLVLAFGLASDLSSLLTYLGLLTAGLAVALQNLILAYVGYFVLVGEDGIRIGDRVQISGVTGDVVEMGLLQFRLREFDLQKQKYTGSVATFSNSFVLLSPASGLLKFDSEASPNPKEHDLGSDERGASAGKH
jgi:hypothetical protein